MTKTLLFSTLLVLALASSACQPGDDASTDSAATSPEAAAADPAAAAEGGVEYEPAYPAEVSTDELSEEDIAQQEKTTHSHGGAEHSHDDKEAKKNGHEH